MFQYPRDSNMYKNHSFILHVINVNYWISKDVGMHVNIIILSDWHSAFLKHFIIPRMMIVAWRWHVNWFVFKKKYIVSFINNSVNGNLGPLDSTSCRNTIVPRKNGRFPEVSIWVYGDTQKDIQETFQDISIFIESNVLQQDILIGQKLIPNITAKEASYKEPRNTKNSFTPKLFQYCKKDNCKKKIRLLR